MIIITTKASKEVDIIIIDNSIEKSSDPNSNPDKRPGHSTKYNINSTLVSYSAILQNNVEPTDNTKMNHPLGVQIRNFQISYDLTSTTDFPSPYKKTSKPFHPDKNNKSTSDQASELSTLDTNIDKCQSMIANNNSTLKSEILYRFKTELNETLKNNNTSLSLKISTDIDNKLMKLQSYLMTLVKELVTETSLLCASSSLSPNTNTSAMLPHNISPPIQKFPSSQHLVGYL